MGTNYYVTENHFDCCNRYDIKYHIGKKSYGWAFSFRGYQCDGLTSWQKWKEYLATATIADEYGDVIPYDKFVEIVESYGNPNYVHPDGRKNLVQNTEGRREGWFCSDNGWDDPEGYSFTRTEFS